MRDPYAATGEVETEIARFLYERQKKIPGFVHINVIEQHLKKNHEKIYGDSVLEAEDLVTNLRNRGLVEIRRVSSGSDDGSSSAICKWKASELDSIAFFANL